MSDDDRLTDDEILASGMRHGHAAIIDAAFEQEFPDNGTDALFDLDSMPLNVLSQYERGVRRARRLCKAFTLRESQ